MFNGNQNLFPVPGSEPRFLEKATSTTANTIVLDLEDGVSIGKKSEARQLVYEALNVADLYLKGFCLLYFRTRKE